MNRLTTLVAAVGLAAMALPAQTEERRSETREEGQQAADEFRNLINEFVRDNPELEELRRMFLEGGERERSDEAPRSRGLGSLRERAEQARDSLRRSSSSGDRRRGSLDISELLRGFQRSNPARGDRNDQLMRSLGSIAERLFSRMGERQSRGRQSSRRQSFRRQGSRRQSSRSTGQRRSSSSRSRGSDRRRGRQGRASSILQRILSRIRSRSQGKQRPNSKRRGNRFGRGRSSDRTRRMQALRSRFGRGSRGRGGSSTRRRR